MNQDLQSGLRALLNQHSAENDSGTPDFILAEYLLACLDAFNAAAIARTAWGQVPTADTVDA